MNESCNKEKIQIKLECDRRKSSGPWPDYFSILSKNGFDELNGWMYHYPVNYPIRAYQFEAIKKALFTNVLLCLPTGLGKTFVAAVVMLNFYRWFPNKKVIFVAPTRPLVAQQMKACIDIVGIPLDETIELTGSLASEKRVSIYERYNILFMTPQVLQNDIINGLCSPHNIVCLVIDEAHRATGNHSFCEIIKCIYKVNNFFRILALSASPGRSIEIIQNLINNLVINEIVFFTEQHPSVKPYMHDKPITPVVLSFEGEIKDLIEEFETKLQALLCRLKSSGFQISTKIESQSSFRFFTFTNTFKQRRNEFSETDYKNIKTLLNVTMSFFGAYERLLFHGVLPFCRYLMKNDSSEGYFSNLCMSELKKDQKFFEKVNNIKTDIESAIKKKTLPKFPLHPKIMALKDILMNYFSKSDSQDTRAMVFSQYRDSVEEIVSVLSLNSPLLRVMHFVGQSSSSSSKHLTQKEQLEAIEKFRMGNFNVLISTCVGEEGLDICEIDLIICFDNSSSPLRLIQRFGRTGRKRSGKIISLMMNGREEKVFKKVETSSSLIEKILTKNMSKLNFVDPVPLIPTHIKPFCVKFQAFQVKQNNTSLKKSKIATKDETAEVPGFHLPPDFDFSFIKPPTTMINLQLLSNHDYYHSTKITALRNIILGKPSFDLPLPKTNKPNPTLPSKKLDNLLIENKDFILSNSDSDFDMAAFPKYLSSPNVHSRPKTPESDNFSEEMIDPIKSMVREDFKENSVTTSPLSNHNPQDEEIFILSDEDTNNCSTKEDSINNLNFEPSRDQDSEIIVLKKRKLIDIDARFSESIFEAPKRPKKSKKLNSPALPPIGRDFLLTQAQANESDSGDEMITPTNLNEYVVDSFIDDKEATPINHVYKQSLVSPSARKHKFKTPSPTKTNRIKNNWLNDVICQIENKIVKNQYESVSDIKSDSSFIDVDISEVQDPIPSPPFSNLHDKLHRTKSNSSTSISFPPQGQIQNSNLCKEKVEGYSSSLELDISMEPVYMDEFMNKDASANVLSSQSSTLLEDSNSINSKVTLLMDATASTHSSLISILRYRFNYLLLNLHNLSFMFIIGHNIGLDIIKSSELVKEQSIQKYVKKYKLVQSLYEKILIIFQHDDSDELDVTSQRIVNILKVFNVFSLNKISIFFSHSQDNSADLISNFVSTLSKDKILDFSIPPLKLAKLIKKASHLCLLNVICPSAALELLINAKSLRTLILNSSPDTLLTYSSHITKYQAQLLHNLFLRPIPYTPTI